MAASPVTTVTGAVTGMGDDLLLVAAAGVGIGATILVVKKGWKLVRGFF